MSANTTTFAPTHAPLPKETPDALPAGWEIADYAGRGGRTMYAVYANGRRMASGMTARPSAIRWARLLIASQP